MDIKRIEILKDKSEKIALTLINFQEVFQETFKELCDITLELSKAIKSIQIDIDAQETYQMEQKERE